MLDTLDALSPSADPVQTELLSMLERSGGGGQLLLETMPLRTLASSYVLNPKNFTEHPIIVIYAGTIGLQHVLKDGRRSISTIFLTGELLDFSHMKIKDGTLICLSPVKLRQFSAVFFERLQRDNPPIRSALTASHFAHWGYTASHCVDLSRKSAVEKLASFIFECRNRQLPVSGNRISLLLKRIDIADYMGLRPETLSRAFAKLKQRNLIAFDGIDHIRILNEPALRQIANGAAISSECAA